MGGTPHNTDREIGTFDQLHHTRPQCTSLVSKTSVPAPPKAEGGSISECIHVSELTNLLYRPANETPSPKILAGPLNTLTQFCHYTSRQHRLKLVIINKTRVVCVGLANELLHEEKTFRAVIKVSCLWL